MRRADCARLTDEELMAQCSVDTYRASGPGGQKRNKTSSAVRLRHGPSGLMTIAEESRSQHDNKIRALRRLRREMALQLRDPFVGPAPDLGVGHKDQRFWTTAGIVLDALEAHAARVRETGAALGVNTAQLIAFLQADPKLWQRANEIRRDHGQKPLF